MTIDRIGRPANSFHLSPAGRGRIAQRSGEGRRLRGTVPLTQPSPIEVGI